MASSSHSLVATQGFGQGQGHFKSLADPEQSMNTLQAAMDIERPGPKSESGDHDGHDGPTSWRAYLMENVDPARAMSPLASYCFMTGFMCVSFSSCGCWKLKAYFCPFLHSDAISFSAVFVWCGFQTGNTVQVRTPSKLP